MPTRDEVEAAVRVSPANRYNVINESNIRMTTTVFSPQSR